MTKLKKYLEANGITQSWLQRQTKISPDRIHRICNGRSPMLADEMLLFSETLNCDPTEIAGEVGEVADVS